MSDLNGIRVDEESTAVGVIGSWVNTWPQPGKLGRT